MRGTHLAGLAQQRIPGLAVLLMSGFSAELLEADRNSPADWELLPKALPPRRTGARDGARAEARRRPHCSAGSGARQRWMKSSSAPTSAIAMSRRPLSVKRISCARASLESARLTVSSVMPR